MRAGTNPPRTELNLHPRLPMIAIYVDAPVPRSRVEALLPGSESHRFETEWQRFEAAVSRAHIVLLIAESVRYDPMPARIALLGDRIRPRPLIVVTRRDAENVRAIANVEVAEVVWLAEMDRSLPAAIREARSTGILDRLGDEIGHAVHLLPRLRAALHLAFRTRPPIASVTALADAVGCDRRTLDSWWREAVRAPPGPTLKEVLEWILIIRAHGARLRRRRWPAIAGELGVHIHTVARIIDRRLGVGLREFAAVDAGELEARLRARLTRIMRTS